MKLPRRQVLGLLSGSSFLKDKLFSKAGWLTLAGKSFADQVVTTGAEPESRPERFEVDYKAFFRRHELTYDQLVLNPAEGLIVGNGDIGAILWQDYNTIKLGLSKNDVWDRRYPNDESPYREPTQSEFISEVRQASRGKTFSGEPAAFSAYPYPENEITLPMEREGARLYDAFLYPTPKPCGSLLMHLPRTSEAMRLQQKLSLYDAVIHLELETADRRIGMRIFAHAHENVFVILIENRSGGGCELLVDQCGFRDRLDPTMTAPTFGYEQQLCWTYHKFPSDAVYQGGFQHAVTTLVSGAQTAGVVYKDRVRLKISLPANGSVTIHTSIATTRDDADPLRETRRLLQATSTEDKPALLEQHKAWWHNYWKKSFITIDDSFAERLWYVQNYLLACCSRPGKVAPGLFGNWIFMERPAWHGDYHLNYNFQSTYWGAYSSNHVEQTAPYYSAILEALPLAQDLARRIYNCRGAKYPLVIYPTRMRTNPGIGMPWDRTMGLSAWVAQGFWWHYEFTQDLEFLRTVAYPFMKECSAFYVDFLRKNAHGKYDVFPTVSPEHHGITANFFLNKNDCVSLSLIKFLMRAMVSASEILSVDQGERSKWTDLLSNLASYPTVAGSSGVVFADVENAPAEMEYNVPVPIAMVFPGEDPDVLADTSLREIATRTAKNIITTTTDSFVVLPVAQMRLGVGSLEQFHRDFRHFILRNFTWTECPNNPDCGPMTDGIGMTLVITEALLQSHEGRIRVLPYSGRLLGSGPSSAAFADLRARGAFLVSSEIVDSRVQYVIIKSLEGSNCTLCNPWPNETPRLRTFPRLEEEKLGLSGPDLHFPTIKETTYVVDREEFPWESFPRRIIPAQPETDVPDSQLTECVFVWNYPFR